MKEWRPPTPEEAWRRRQQALQRDAAARKAYEWLEMLNGALFMLDFEPWRAKSVPRHVPDAVRTRIQQGRERGSPVPPAGPHCPPDRNEWRFMFMLECYWIAAGRPLSEEELGKGATLMPWPPDLPEPKPGPWIFDARTGWLGAGSR